MTGFTGEEFGRATDSSDRATLDRFDLMNLPVLHVVTGDEIADRADFLSLATRLYESLGSDLALHLRLKQTTGRRFLDLARALSATADRAGGWCAVNERLDVALAAGAQAVQQGRTALPVAVAREVVRTATASRPIAIGASVHGKSEARQAVVDGANFVVLGTIFSSRSHPGVRPHGPAIVEQCRDIGAPLIAIGGIDSDAVRVVKRAGADGIAVISAVWGEGDPIEAARSLIETWKAS